jgi:hypothetical protein
MSNVTDTSLTAYRKLALTEREREVMLAVHQHYDDGSEFTRAELAAKMSWEINRITGRVFDLVAKGYLAENKSRTVECQITKGAAHPLRLSVASRGSNSAGNMADEFRSPAECGEKSSRQTPKKAVVVAAHGAHPDTSSEAFRHSCEVSFVAAMTVDHRRAFFSGLAGKRSVEMIEKLRKDVWAIVKKNHVD